MVHSDMQHKLIAAAATLSDTDLLHRLCELSGRERRATVELVAHLAELQRRKLYREHGYGSPFAYCTDTLRLSEHATFNRLAAARASRRFPVVLDLLAEGAVNLSTLRLLVPHLTRENHQRLLAEARGKSKREVAAIVARLVPQPDVPASVRKLPARAGVAAQQVASASAALPGAVHAAERAELAPPVPTPFGAAVPFVPPPAAAARPIVAPLSAERYRVQFTVSRETQEKLRQVQDLLRREIPDGDPGVIFERALTLLLEDVARKKLAATPNPRPGRAGDSRSRHVPAEVKRKVWVRDHGQCAFVSPSGRRCRERTFLEFHHLAAYARGGETTVENISLRCREHNAHEAELEFGPWDPTAVREPWTAYSTWSGAAGGRHNELRPTRPGASRDDRRG
jgi:hypothetical protein